MQPAYFFEMSANNLYGHSRENFISWTVEFFAVFQYQSKGRNGLKVAEMRILRRIYYTQETIVF
jgi:hypothetical protein